MASEQEKGRIEVEVFQHFAQAAGLHVSAVEKQLPEGGIPDLKCMINGEVVYFELAEACSEDIVKAMVLEQQGSEVNFARAKDFSFATYKKKIEKQYSVSEPVELLLYNVGRSVLPDRIIIETIQNCAHCGKGQFRKIWYFGEHAQEIL